MFNSRSMTLRARLLVLGGGGVLAVIVLGLASLLNAPKLVHLLVAAVSSLLLLAVLVTTLRSTMSGIRHVEDRVNALMKAMMENLGPGLAALAEGDFTRHLAGEDEAREGHPDR